MNIGKDSRCVFNRNHRDKLLSFVMIVSTVGESPRRQTSTKSTKVCAGCLPLLSSLNRPEVALPINSAIETLTGRPEALTSIVKRGQTPESAVRVSLKAALSVVGKHAARCRWGNKRRKK